MKEASFDNWTILFLLVAAQGLFLSVLLFSKKSSRLNYLAGVIVLFSLMLSYYVLFWTGYNRHISRIFGVSLGFTLLLGPLLLLYLRKDLKSKLRHFIPFTIYVILFFTIPFLGEFKMTASKGLASFQCIHLLIYSWLIFDSTSNWRRTVSYSFLIYTLAFNAYYIFVWTGMLKIEYDYLISIISAIFIYNVGYQSFLNPKAVSLITMEKYKNSALSLSASEAIFSAVKVIMESEKIYRNSELKLSTLADQLGFSSNHISQVINERTNNNFSDFINSYRINEAKKLILEAKEKPVFIEIAYDVGFNNKTSFNNAFKKLTQQSPSEFYISTLQKMSA